MSRGLVALGIVTLALGLAEVALDAHALLPWGATGLFGFIGCVAIVVAAKALGKAWLQRREPPDE